MDDEEELVHLRVWPEAVQFLHHVPGAVGELPVAPAGGKAGRQALVGRGPGGTRAGGSPPQSPVASSTEAQALRW